MTWYHVQAKIIQEAIFCRNKQNDAGKGKGLMLQQPSELYPTPLGPNRATYSEGSPVKGEKGSQTYQGIWEGRVHQGL